MTQGVSMCLSIVFCAKGLEEMDKIIEQYTSESNIVEDNDTLVVLEDDKYLLSTVMAFNII